MANRGGAIVVFNKATLETSENEFEENLSIAEGGAIFLAAKSTFKLFKD